MAKSAKKADKKSTDIPAWMASFTDMVTLLFCFFVMLFAMAEIDPARMRDISQHFAARPTIVEIVGSDSLFELMSSGIEDVPDPGERVALRVERMREIDEMFAEIETWWLTYFGEDVVILDTQLVETDDGLLYYYGEIMVMLPNFSDVDGAVLFESARWDLQPAAHEFLAVVGEIIEQYPNALLQITGHTDNVPFPFGPFADPDRTGSGNQALSFLRAMAVQEFLISEFGALRENITVYGAGQWSPIGDNATPEGRQANRRVEIRVFVRRLVDIP